MLPSDSNPVDLQSILAENRDRLCRMVRLRMDPRLKGRVDESDVIQEAYVEAAERFDQFQKDGNYAPYVWLRLMTMQKLFQIHRRHIKAQVRSVSREAGKQDFGLPAATSIVLANELVGARSTPLQAAIKAEMVQRVTGALEQLSEEDREMLAMRHFEHMTINECAETFEISVDAAYKRYFRALKKLKSELGQLPDSVALNL